MLLCAGNAFGRAKHYGQLFGKSGRPRSGAELCVFRGRDLAVLYRDSEGKTKLENPVTTGKDGVYWFYADNGRYAIAEKVGSGYRVIDPEAHLFDPGEPQTLTASSSEIALTLTHTPSRKEETGKADPKKAPTDTSIVMRREDGPDIEKKGPWRMKYVGRGREPTPPRGFLLLYNTDLRKDEKGRESWAPRDMTDVCILFKITPANGTGGWGWGGYFRYAVAESGPAGSIPVFRDAVNVTGSPVNTAGSLLKVGAGIDKNTRYFRNRYGRWVPFAFSTTYGSPAQPEPQRYGEVRVLNRAGSFRNAPGKGAPHPQVVASGFLSYAAAGESFVRLAPGVTVKPGDTLVASAHGGCAEVDNSEMDVNRIIGWALEKSGQTSKGYVFVVLK
ncbi:MAG: hypothetical protein CMN05_15275 [Roseibacillus sp.]|jgi:hypothetical protein|nr:hypothetical protein [Roseibacillus sp.]|tara:strand:- start:15800 stop:16963 length:1164 start_codon:yes stop_codon:yes gene_type:complete